MIVEELELRDFRCFEKARFEPAAQANVVIGDNASGKSSVLEALFILGRGASFRPPGGDLIRDGARQFNLAARVLDDNGVRHRLAAEGARGRTRFRYDNSDATRVDLVKNLPLQLIDPNVHRLLEYGPRHRRRFMDWGVFHVEQTFFPAWRRYRRALRQRNHTLRQRGSKNDVIAWNRELVHQAEVIDAARRAYLEQLEARLPAYARLMFGDQPVTFDYKRGWRQTDSLGAVLDEALEQDRRRGFTEAGPHRADLRIGVKRSRVRDRASRGQQKLLTATLLLVQAQILRDRRGLAPVILIDDLAAELGGDFRRRVGQALRDMGGQSFVTFLDESFVPSSLAGGGFWNLDSRFA